MANVPSNLEPLESDEIRQLNEHAEYNEAVSLTGYDLEIQTAEGPKRLQIAKVEPFSEMLQPSHKRAFEKKPRNQGELFFIWFRGNTPFLNVVVDSEQQSIVCVKTLLIDGQEVSATTLLKMMGFERNRFAKGSEGAKLFRDSVEGALDGKQIYRQPEGSIIRLEKPKSGAIVELRKETGQRAENSLGVFVNTAHYNKRLLEAGSH